VQVTERFAIDVLRDALDWLDEFYGPVEVYDWQPLKGKVMRGMVQLDHGDEEYEARMDVAAKVRAFFEDEALA